MYYGIYELYSSIISDIMHSYIILLFIVTVFIFYNMVLHGISITNIVCTCSYWNMHNPRLVSSGMEYVYWWRFETLVSLFSIIQIIVHIMTLNNVKTQLLSDSHIKFLAVFARHFLKDFIKLHYDQYEQISSNVYGMINYYLNYFENICQFVNSCECRPLATIMYLDYLCKNNILNIIVGCFLIFYSLLICQVCSGQNSNGIQSNIASRFNINYMCNPNVFTISQRYLSYFVLQCLQIYKSVYKLMLVYYYYWNMCSLIILQHVGLYMHILKITYYISWLTCTLQRQYLQLKHSTDTDIYSRTIELYAPLKNLISLRQQWIGYNII